MASDGEHLFSLELGAILRAIRAFGVKFGNSGSPWFRAAFRGLLSSEGASSFLR